MPNFVKKQPPWLAVFILSLGFSVPASAVETESTESSPEQTAGKIEAIMLPNPLTLEYVLSHSLNEHPQLQLQQALINQIRAQQLLQSSTDKTQLNLVGRLGWRDYADKTEKYNLAALQLTQKLYDFNQNGLLNEALSTKEQAQQMLVIEAENQLKLQIMQAYFNVVLADFQYRIDNEAMAVAYIKFDKAEDMYELSRISDVEFLEIETEYETILTTRTRSENRQLKSRIALVNLMGLPQARPDELILPELKIFSKRDVQELELASLYQQVVESNREIQFLKQQVQAGLLEMQSKQAQGKPTISLDARAGHLSSYPEIREGHWSVGLLVDMPLYDGGSVDAKVSQVKAKVQELDARMKLKEQLLRDEVSDLYFQLRMLKSEQAQNQKFGDYSDLYLDYSRALYENDSTADLGDAMVRLSQANYDQINWQFKQALLWSKLDLLMAKPLFDADDVQQLQAMK